MTYHLVPSQIPVGKSILVQVMTKVSEVEEQFQAYEWKAGRCWMQCLALLWHAWITSGGQRRSRALLGLWTESVPWYPVAVLPWPPTQLDAPLQKGENIWVLWWDSCLASSQGNMCKREKWLCKHSLQIKCKKWALGQDSLQNHSIASFLIVHVEMSIKL